MTDNPMTLVAAKTEIDRIIRENRAILTLQSILDSAIAVESEVASAQAKIVEANKAASDAEASMEEVKAKTEEAIKEEVARCAEELENIRAKHRINSADTLNKANALLNESVSAANAAKADLADIMRQVDEAEATLAVIKGDIVTLQELQATERKTLADIRAAIKAAAGI